MLIISAPRTRKAQALVRPSKRLSAMVRRTLSAFALLHGTATAQNDAMEARAMMAAAPGVSAASLKRHVGHQLAGAGAFNAAVAWSLLKGLGSTPLNFSRSSHPDPELPAAFRAALSGPENTSSDLTAKLDSPGAPGVLASAFAFGGSNAVLFFTARQELDQ